MMWIFGISIFLLQMSEADFQAVPEVEIDTGVFKYVLIRLYRYLETEKDSQCAYDVNAASAK